MADTVGWFRSHRSPVLLLGRVAVVVYLGVAPLSCSSYRSAPLPALADAAAPPVLDEGSARAAVLALDNPLLAPVKVVFADGLSPRQFGVLAAALNPDIQALRRRHGEAAAEVVQVRLLPNPTLGVDSAFPFGTGSAGLSAAYNIAASLSTRQLLTRRVRTRGAQAHVRAVDLSIAWHGWQVAQQARLEALRLGWLRRRFATASRELALQAEATKLVADAVAAGYATIDQAAVERAALEAVRMTVSALERARTRTRARLLALLGVAELPPARLRSFAVPAKLPPRPSVSELLPGCLARRLDLAALRAGYEAQEARLRQAVLEQFPDITVGLTHGRDEASLKFLGGLVSLAVPVFDHNQAGVAKERATRARLAAEYRARALHVRAAVGEMNGLLQVIEKRLPELRAALEPLSRNEAAERQAAARGDVDRLSYRSARVALLDQQLLVASLSQARGEAIVGLETACGGTPLPAGQSGEPS